MKLIEKTTFICLDCETTGLNIEEDRIIEFAAIKFQGKKELARLEFLVDPQMDIPQESIKIHNISNEMIRGKLTIKEVLPDILKFIDSQIIVGHQIGFDLAMLKAAAIQSQIPHQIDQLKSIDTLRLARAYGNAQKNSLEFLAKHFHVPVDQTHRALSDVLLNIEVFYKLTQNYHTLNEIFRILDNPIKMAYMPLGKYKGQAFNELPDNYLHWAKHQNFDQDLIYSIRLEIKKRKQKEGFTKSNNPFQAL